MKWMKLFGGNKNGAETAKDRLQIVIAQQRSGNAYPDYMPILRQEIIALIAKHTHVDSDAIHVDLQCKDNNAFLELNVALPTTSTK